MLVAFVMSVGPDKLLMETNMLTLRTITREPWLDELLHDTLGALDWRYDGAWTPAVNVEDQADAIRITTEIPGVKPDQVQISVEGNTLAINGAKGELTFHRSFTLPASVDAAAIKAGYENGVLTVTLPKAEKAKPRQIAVEVVKS